MNCPPAIAEILLEILRTGLLHIRQRGWQNDADGCAQIADHLHNLPELLGDYSPERLLYYWQVERPIVLEQSQSDEMPPFSQMWDLLEKLLPPGGSSTLPAAQSA